MLVSLVSDAIRVRIVCVAINFDDEGFLRAEEVDNAIADDMLSPKLETA